ncbi:MAG: hypothetical protein HXY22_10725 [Alphaproteobacteria bacterium]|nr:hypothetical protein [Alphaproteobacteria bacterium]
MSRQIHFEIFVRYGKGPGWSLFDAIPERDDAIKAAEAVLKEGRVRSVRVNRETFQEETGQFTTFRVFEAGETLTPRKAAKADPVDAGTPCFKPDDFYSVHARATLIGLLSDALSRWRITVTELIHHAGALERLELTGTLFQHAVQKIAVAQAKGSDEPITKIVRTLSDLASKAMARVYRDERAGRLAAVTLENVKAMADGLGANPEGEYLLKAGIAKYLEPIKSWEEKLAAVLALLSQMPEAGKGHDLLLEAIDVLVSEIVTCGSALAELLGPQPNLGTALLVMGSIVQGHVVPGPEGERKGLSLLAAEFSAGRLRAARAAIAKRVLAELKGMKRLVPNSLEEDVRVLRQIVSRLIDGGRPVIPMEDIVSAVTIRAKRLVTPESIEEFLSETKNAAERLTLLLHMEENIVGTENKRRLAGYILPIITAHQAQNFFMQGGPPLEQLKLLAGLQSKVCKSGFQEMEIRKISETLDALAVRLEKKHQVIGNALRAAKSPLEMLELSLGLFEAGAVLEGELAQMLRKQIWKILSNREAMAGLGKARKPDPATLMQRLARAGIDTANAIGLADAIEAAAAPKEQARSSA